VSPAWVRRTLRRLQKDAVSTAPFEGLSLHASDVFRPAGFCCWPNAAATPPSNGTYTPPLPPSAGESSASASTGSCKIATRGAGPPSSRPSSRRGCELLPALRRRPTALFGPRHGATEEAIRPASSTGQDSGGRTRHGSDYGPQTPIEVRGDREPVQIAVNLPVNEPSKVPPDVVKTILPLTAAPRVSVVNVMLSVTELTECRRSPSGE